MLKNIGRTGLVIFGIALLINLANIRMVNTAQAKDVQAKIAVIRGDMIRLDKGRQQGVTQRHTALVVRDDRYIALLKIKNIQSSTAIAELVEKNDTVKENDTVIIGDSKEKVWWLYGMEQRADLLFQKGEYQEAENIYQQILESGESSHRIRTKLEKIPKMGTLVVHSNPPGARIYLDGSYLGKTPLKKHLLAVGNYPLKLVKSDWQNETVQISVEKYKTTRVDAGLKKERPQKPTAKELGRAYWKELDFSDEKKNEYKKVYRKAPTSMKIISETAFVSGLGCAAIMLYWEVKMLKKIDEKKNAKKETINTGLFFLLGGTCFEIANSLDDKMKKIEKTPKRIRIPYNISYNQKLKKKVEEHNRKARLKNKEIDNLIEREYSKRLREWRFINHEREIKVTTE
ncbi:PEGA domain-containing protein [candidate division KSB1 bacterium]|nr:PEGA domain-containing protein [candidate division KSB1 bacterium]